MNKFPTGERQQSVLFYDVISNERVVWRLCACTPKNDLKSKDKQVKSPKCGHINPPKTSSSSKRWSREQTFHRSEQRQSVFLLWYVEVFLVHIRDNVCLRDHAVFAGEFTIFTEDEISHRLRGHWRGHDATHNALSGMSEHPSKGGIKYFWGGKIFRERAKKCPKNLSGFEKS